MADTPIPPDLVQDPFEQNVPGLGLGRDPVRTPMPWTAGPMAASRRRAPGFRSNAAADAPNVANQVGDRDRCCRSIAR